MIATIAKRLHEIEPGVLRNQPTGARGSGKVLTLKFRALSAGSGEVSLQSFDAVATGVPTLPATLPAPWQVNVR